MQRKQHSEHDIFVTSLYLRRLERFFELQVVTVVAFDDSFLFYAVSELSRTPLG